MRARLQWLSGLFLVLLLVLSRPPTGKADPSSAKELPSFISFEIPGPNPLVEEMIDQVNSAQVADLAKNLSGEQPVLIGGQPYTITTRNSFSGEPIQKAAQYLVDFYQQLGLQVSRQEFVVEDATIFNVIAQKTGSIFPERIYTVTAHYDDMPRQAPAPGADDNASGTVGVMLAAQILSQYDFGCTLRFINFAGEEQELLGSSAYTHRAYCQREDQRGAINLDMIGWNSLNSEPKVDLHADPTLPGSPEMADLFQQVVENYGLDLEPEVVSPPTYASDHARFWAFDIPAILIIEDFGDFNPNYHSRQDTVDHLEDLEYFASMIQASLATLAHMGCLVEDGWGEVAGRLLDLDSGMPVHGGQVFLYNPIWGYTLPGRADQDGEYHLAVPAGDHLVYADARGYAPVRRTPEPILILPGQTAQRDIYLREAQESQQFVPIAADRGLKPPAGCP